MKKLKKKVFLIAEVGINHEGKLNKCLQMIKSAKLAGADAVKLQVVSPSKSYEKGTKSFKIFSNVCFNQEQLKKIFLYAKKINIKIFATCDTEENIKKIQKFNPFAFKISSGLANNIYLIKFLKKIKKKIIISVGLLKKKEIQNILNILGNYKNVVFMHSVSRYPTKNYDLNLNSIDFLKSFLKDYDIGYSDHTTTDDAILTAVSKGCGYIEKHFTYDKKRKNFDHLVSYEKDEFKELKKRISKIEESLGKNVFLNNNFQRKERSLYLRYIVAKNKIDKNTLLKFNDVNFMRVKNSNKAIEPTNLYKFLNKRVKINIKAGKIIKINDFKKR
jgi:sialic acid synthase SpsE